MSPREDHHEEAPVPGLRELYVNRPAPEHLEDRVVEAVRARGWGDGGGESAGRHTRPSRPLRVAAGIVLFAAGFASGGVVAPFTGNGGAIVDGTDGSTAMDAATHMLVLWEGPDFAPDAPPPTIAAQYGAWLAGVARNGGHMSGNELAPVDIRRIHGPDDPEGLRTTTPPVGARIGGYFLVEVPDDATAAELAAGHPHLEHGGWIEVAPITRR